MAVEDSLHLEAQLVQAIELLRPLATVDRARHLLALLVLRSVEESPLHAIHLPSEVSWRALVSSAGLPDQLNHAFQLIERNNELLTGVFQDIDFNSSKLGSESERKHIARQVMFLVSNCPLVLVRTGAAAEVLPQRLHHATTGGMFVT